MHAIHKKSFRWPSVTWPMASPPFPWNRGLPSTMSAKKRFEFVRTLSTHLFRILAQTKGTEKWTETVYHNGVFLSPTHMWSCPCTWLLLLSNPHRSLKYISFNHDNPINTEDHKHLLSVRFAGVSILRGLLSSQVGRLIGGQVGR